jgi:thiamine monophosphate synthase
MRRAGAFGAAVITAILGADDIESATRELLDAVTPVP